MKYYAILLLNGKIVEINSFDEEDARDRVVESLLAQMTWTFSYDEVQTLDEVQ